MYYQSRHGVLPLHHLALIPRSIRLLRLRLLPLILNSLIHQIPRRRNPTRSKVQESRILVIIQMREERVEPIQVSLTIQIARPKKRGSNSLIPLLLLPKNPLINLPLLKLLNLLLILPKINLLPPILLRLEIIIAFENRAFEK